MPTADFPAIARKKAASSDIFISNRRTISQRNRREKRRDPTSSLRYLAVNLRTAKASTRLIWKRRRQARAEMKENPKRKTSLADAAMVAAGDPFGWFYVLLVFGKHWKIGLIFLALVAIVGMIIGFLILWTRHWDI
jgi:hypothetical protein